MLSDGFIFVPNFQRAYSEDFEYSSMIRVGSRYRFSTVDYNNQLFKEYVIDRTMKDKIGLKTESAKRIVVAYDFFSAALSQKTEEDLLAFYSAVKNASCGIRRVGEKAAK